MKFRMFLLCIAALMAAGLVFGSGICTEDTTMVERTLVAPSDYSDYTNTSWGNGYPWQNNTAFFSTFRNQYLFPAAAFPAEARTVESLGARSVTFTGAQTTVMETPSGPKGRGWDHLEIMAFYGGMPAMALNFAANRTGVDTVDFQRSGDGTNPTLGLTYDPLFECFTAGNGDISHGLPKFTPILWTGSSADPDLMLDCGVDMTSSGHSGYCVWDMGQSQGCLRAYGSSSYFGRNWLTQAYGIDDMAFVWVFRGLAGPPPASLDANIKEIVRLLVTPEALRCTDLDTNPNGVIHDDAVQFPMGKDIDPVSPQVTTNAPLHMEEETDRKSVV